MPVTDLAAVRRLFSRDDPEQCGFTRPVAADETNAFVVFNNQIGVVQDRLITEPQRYIIKDYEAHN